MNVTTTPRSAAHQQLHRLLPGLMLGLFMAALDQTIVAAVLQGIGAAGLLATTQALVGDLLEPAERGRYQGWFSGRFALPPLLIALRLKDLPLRRG